MNTAPHPSLLKKVDFSKGSVNAYPTIDGNWDLLKKWDTAAKAAGTFVGRTVTHPYADGNAVYVVTKEGKRTMTIEVCAGLGDDWVLPAWGKKATIPKTYLRS